MGANSQTVDLDYDVHDNPTARTDGKNETTDYSFDGLGRLVGELDPDDFTVGYTHDLLGRISTVTDQRGLSTSYQYDGLGNLMQLDSPDTGLTTFGYDAAGNRTSGQDARGVQVQYSYDALNRLTGVSYPATPAENVSYSYDDVTGGNPGVGRLTGISDASGTIAYTYDHRGNVTQKDYTIGGVAYSIGYAYDLADRITQITYPGGRLVNLARDSQGRISGITTQSGAGPLDTVLSNVGYKPFGPVDQYTYGNGVLHTVDYDQDYRVLTNSAVGNTTLFDSTYGHDLNNNIDSIADPSYTPANQSFQYDKLDRLEQAQGAYGQLDYQYDGVGNRTLRTHLQGGNTRTDSYTYESTSNRLADVFITEGASQSLRTLQYDSAGNPTQDTRPDGAVHTSTYNAANRHSSLNRGTVFSATYSYNSLGQRTAKQAVGNVTIGDHYHYDEAGRLLAVTTTGGVLKREMIYLDNLLVATLVDDSYASEWDAFDNGSDQDGDGVTDVNDNCPTDANPNQTDTDTDGVGNVCDPEQYVAISIDSEDGWTRESGEDTDVGGSRDINGQWTRAIRLGDDGLDRQFRAVLSFDISGIPAGSTLTGINLELKRLNQSIIGDLSSFGLPTIDLKTGGLDGNAALEPSDFQASPTVPGAATLVDGLTATAAISAAGKIAVQTAFDTSETKVQLRLSFLQDDNDNQAEDSLGYYPGGATNPDHRPKLVVDYVLAD